MEKNQTGETKEQKKKENPRGVRAKRCSDGERAKNTEVVTELRRKE